MPSPGQMRGGCGHLTAGFDTHNYCVRCRDRGKGPDPCVEKPDSNDCNFCNILTPEQRIQLSTPSYKIKKEQCECKKTATPNKEPTSSDTHSHPCGPGTCVGSGGRGWPGHC